MKTKIRSTFPVKFIHIILSMFGAVYADTSMPNWPHRHRTHLPGIASPGLHHGIYFALPNSVASAVFFCEVGPNWDPRSQARWPIALYPQFTRLSCAQTTQDYYSSCRSHKYVFVIMGTSQKKWQF